MMRKAVLDREKPAAEVDDLLPGAPAADGVPGDPGRRPAARRGGLAGLGRFASGGSPAESARAPRRGGAGGRWLVWLGRAIAWAVLLLIGYRGVTAIVTGQPVTASAARGATGSSSDHGFPVTLGEAYALQFGSAYLNYSPGRATQRAHALAAFLPPGADPQLGWNGAGSQSLQSEQVAGIRVQSGRQAIITLLAEVNGHLLELGVPVYASGSAIAAGIMPPGGGLVISGEPAFLPAPSRVSPPQSQAVAATDTAAQSQLMNQLPAFFRAFASGDSTLGRFLAPGSQVTGMGGAVEFGGISQLVVPAGGQTRQITASVGWKVPSGRATSGGSSVGAISASIPMTYQMTVAKIGGTWYVASVGASGQLPGPP